MPTNIEIKARVRDFIALRDRVEKLSNVPIQILPQVDTFFRTNNGRLKLREQGTEAGQLIYYERPDQPGPKRSDFSIFETEDPASLKSILTASLGVRGSVRKVRYLALIDQTRVHLDDVESLGRFMELEVMLRADQSEAEGRAIAERLLLELGIEESDLLESAYMDLLEQQA